MDGMESLKSQIQPKNGYMQYLKTMMSLVVALRFHGQFHLGKWITVAVMTPLIQLRPPLGCWFCGEPNNFFYDPIVIFLGVASVFLHDS